MNSTRLDGRSLERLWKRQVVVILIALLIAVAHILPLEKNLRGVSSALYFSYFSDFVIPFAWYFLLSTPLETV